MSLNYLLWYFIVPSFQGEFSINSSLLKCLLENKFIVRLLLFWDHFTTLSHSFLRTKPLLALKSHS